MRDPSIKRRPDVLRDGSATITLRISNGYVKAQLTQDHLGGAVSYGTITGDMVTTVRVRRLLESLLRQTRQSSSGDLVFTQLELLGNDTDG